MFGITPYERRNNAMTYDPFKAFDNFEREFFKNGMMAEFKTDIKDNGKEYELLADLPGFRKEDINIELDDNCLTIQAERRFENEEKDKKGNYVRRERSYGSFSRSFDVSGIEVSAIKASYEDGVLKLVLPKKLEITPAARRLEIE
ncbi:MAG: Hsp20/alpha crystallin family protein [bacterium]|nr:Hsp20/alpha crystallin family protein [bacterium]